MGEAVGVGPRTGEAVGIARPRLGASASRRTVLAGAFALAALSQLPAGGDPSVELPVAATSAETLTVLQRLQAVALQYPADRSDPGVPVAQHIQPGYPRLRLLYESSPRPRRMAIRRGAGWLTRHVDLTSPGRFVDTLRASDLHRVSASTCSDILAATSVAICAAATKLTGAGDAAAWLWLSGAAGQPLPPGVRP